MTPELFLVDSGDATLLYAPLKGVLARLPVEVASELRAVSGERFSERTSGVLAALGLVEDPRSVTLLPPVTVSEEFAPTGVIFLVTGACNLRCTYCYADAGDHVTDPFDRQMGADAVRMVIENAAREGASTAHLSFHGGGEPTLDFEFIVAMTELARSLASDLPSCLEVNASLVTNGLLPDAKARWIAKNIDSVQVSLDGPAAIHDLQRPTLRGGSSHRRVEEVVRLLQDAGVDLMIKATISSAVVDQMDEIAEYLCRTFDLPRFHLGPVLGAGRGRSLEFGQPSVEAFVAGYRRARVVAERYGRTLVVSGAQATFPAVRRRFCGVTDPNFALGPDGSISSCYEVIYPDDPRAPRFHYGRYDPLTRAFSVDPDKMRRLRSTDVTTIPRCQDCFAKWHCAGDCQARWYASTDGSEEAGVDVRCGVARELIRESLVSILDGH